METKVLPQDYNMSKNGGLLKISIFLFSLLTIVTTKTLQDEYCSNEPVDIVFTWVNGSDPIFIKNKQNIISGEYQELNGEELSKNRFADNDELKYSLRSVIKHVPWIRNVYIVTNGQIPKWLNLDNPRIRIVTHEEIFLNQSHLPTFSSRAIESHIHRIQGLSKHYIYSNDDMFFGKNISIQDYHTSNRGYKLYRAWKLGDCNHNCTRKIRGDTKCDERCNTLECDWDNDDCLAKNNNHRKENRNGAKSSSQASSLNAYEGSMHFVSNLYDKELGYFERHAISHMPLLLNKEIVNEMHDRFASYFELTSSYKIRHSKSMQPTFAYVYYIFGAKENYTHESIFERLDIDQSGSLSAAEIKKFTFMSFNKEININTDNNELLTENCIQNFTTKFGIITNSLKTCRSKSTSQSQLNSQDITRETFLACVNVWKYYRMDSYKSLSKKYRYELLKGNKTSEITEFLMINNDIEHVNTTLNALLAHPKQFICFNDDLDNKDKNAYKIRRLIREFYKKKFPVQSEFELENQENKFLHLDEIKLCLSRNPMMGYGSCLVELQKRTLTIKKFSVKKRKIKQKENSKIKVKAEESIVKYQNKHAKSRENTGKHFVNSDRLETRPLMAPSKIIVLNNAKENLDSNKYLQIKDRQRRSLEDGRQVYDESANYPVHKDQLINVNIKPTDDNSHKQCQIIHIVVFILVMFYFSHRKLLFLAMFLVRRLFITFSRCLLNRRGKLRKI